MTQHRALIAVAAGLLLLLSTLHLIERLHSPALHNLLPWLHSYAPKSSSSSAITHDDDFDSDFLVGVGKADITGPVVEVNFMGYADADQVGSGLRQRLYSRAFIVGNELNTKDRFVYLVLDTQSGDTAVRNGIIEALASLGDEYAMYGNQNIAVTGTHSHSGPGAWLNYLLPQITSKGFHYPSYQAIVDGAVMSIMRAHNSLAPGRLHIGTIAWHDININRSPYAYQANPYAERYKYGEQDVDKNMTVLRFSHQTDNDFKDIGILTWFAVHGTSMYANNTLVTGDNKGVSAYLFEKSMHEAYVAGFSQSNVGDTTPNVEGAYCEYGEQAGKRCDFKTSLCAGKTQPCHGRGPYWGIHDHGTASTFEIGRRQYTAAKVLTKSDHFRRLRGPVKAAHKFVDFSSLSFRLPNGTLVKTCPAALGHSFAAGTSDQAGRFDFKQAQPGDPHTNPLWSLVSNRIHKPNETQIACHGAKPILLDVGESSSPYAWSPNIADIQVFRAGDLFIVVSPGEATTMAGRRWRDAVRATVQDPDVDPMVVLGGPANSYTHYITTPEEYAVQRYEGASTLYGPHTLAAYLDQSVLLVELLLDNNFTTEPSRLDGPEPPINTNRSRSFINEPIFDRSGVFKTFGQLLTDVKKENKHGDSISAVFVAANPRNNLRLEQTYAAVERLNVSTGEWNTIRDDYDWSLVFAWRRTSTVLGTSEVEITWETKWEAGTWRPLQARSTETLEIPMFSALLSDFGTYRLKYYGDAKALNGEITPFVGVSGNFFFSG